MVWMAIVLQILRRSDHDDKYKIQTKIKRNTTYILVRFYSTSSAPGPSRSKTLFLGALVSVIFLEPSTVTFLVNRDPDILKHKLIPPNFD